MKFYKSYRKYLFKRDTLFATISVFILIGFLALIPLNTKVLNPIKTALVDFDFNDIAYAKLGKNSNTPLDNRIIVVNIGTADRAQIAGMIESISAARPKVIGVDASFNGPREPQSDALLQQVLQTTPRLVAASRLNWSKKGNVEDKGFFSNTHNQFGYVNFVGEDGGTIRYFSPSEQFGDQQFHCFSATLLKEADPDCYKRLAKRDRELETIHYKRRSGQYLVVNGEDLLAQKVSGTLFQNKYVLLGYVSPTDNDVEDKHFTPMNYQFAGKALPDMNGVIIHANILSMMLDGDYVRKLPGWINWLIIILIAWLHITLFIRYYIEDHLWFHLAAKVAQIASAILFVYLSIMLFHWFRLRLEIKIPLIVIILAIDVIYFYEAFALWLHKKFQYRTIFNHKTH
jgi:CHASE2 domain-containing sensor protein